MSDRDQICHRCHAPVRWATTNNGRRVQLDATPDQTEGSVALVTIARYHQEPLEIAVTLKDGEDSRNFVLRDAREGGVPLYVTHWTICPGRPEQLAA